MIICLIQGGKCSMIGEHYYYFGDYFNEKLDGDTLNKNNWDILRKDIILSPFSIENTQEEYEKNCMKSELYIKAAKIICNEIGNDKKIVSCGIGKGILESNIKILNNTIKIDGTDYSPESINKLKKVCKYIDKLFVFDLNTDNYKILKEYDYVIFYRLSTEFDIENWKKIFRKLHEENIMNIIFVPTELANEDIIEYEKRAHIKRKEKNIRDTFCGWLYSEDEFYNMWDKYYKNKNEFLFGDTKIYFLQYN